MIDTDTVLLNNICRAYSDPLFIQSYFLRNGHNEFTINATATFVKYEGRYYVCTCRHVTKIVEKSQNENDDNWDINLALMTESMSINLSHFTAMRTLKSTFNSPEKAVGENSEIDVSITDISSLWDFFCTKKSKIPIDLDLWEEPPWPDIKVCATAGYGSEHKERKDAIVATPMLYIVAETASALNRDCQEFTLSSKLEEPPGYYLSGISGGPILALWEDKVSGMNFRPIGLVFEGSPSSENLANIGSGLTGPNDILIRGLLMTPDIFSNWLKRI